MTEPSAQSTATTDQPEVVIEPDVLIDREAVEDLVEEDLLIEEISIDGMCGVY